jgi:hypothetical protein
MITTLRKIEPYVRRDETFFDLDTILAYLGKAEVDDEPLPITTILDSNGLEDALWALRTVEGHDQEIRLFAVWCARRVQHLIKDERSLNAIDVAEAFAKGKATEKDLYIAWSAALMVERENPIRTDSKLLNAEKPARTVAQPDAWAAALETASVAACNAGKIKKMDGYFLRDATDRAKIQEAWEAQEAEFRRICLKSKEEQGEFGKNRTDTENWFSMTDLLIKIFNKNGEEGKDLCVDEIKCVMCFDKLQELRAMNAELQRVLGITHSFVAEITRAGGEYSYLDKTPIVADAYPILSGIESAIAKAQGTLISSDAKK